MTRITLIILLGLSILVSFPTQAGGRDGHYNKHHGGHYNKYQRHHYKHHSHHYYSHGGHRYRFGSYYGYGVYPQFYTIPHVSLGTRYGYSASGALIVYPTYPYADQRY